MTKLRPFCITVIFYYQKEAQKCPVFYSGHVGGSRIVVPIPKTCYIKNTGKKLPSYNPLKTCAQKSPVFYSGCVGGSRMVVPIPKIGYNKKSGKKNDQVMALFYNCRFYYRKEAHKFPVFRYGHVGVNRMTIPILKIGYNKNNDTKWPSYGPFV